MIFGNDAFLVCEAGEGDAFVFLEEVLGDFFHKHCGFVIAEGDGDDAVAEVFIYDLELDYELLLLAPGGGGCAAVAESVGCSDAAVHIGVAKLGEESKFVFVNAEGQLL